MMTVIPFVSNRPFIRLCAVRPMLEEFMKAAINECALAVHVLPEDILAGRDKLTACLTEQLRDLGQQGTQMDALGHFGFIHQPGEAPTYFGGLTESEVVGPTGLKRLGIDKAEPIITSVVLLDAATYLNNGGICLTRDSWKMALVT
jgi:hypothetical protein